MKTPAQEPKHDHEFIKPLMAEIPCHVSLLRDIFQSFMYINVMSLVKDKGQDWQTKHDHEYNR